MKKLLMTIVIFIGIGVNTFAGDKSNKEIRGDKHFFVYSFDKAIDSYTQVKHLSAEGQRRLAESYHNIGQNNQAEIIYSTLINISGEVLPEDYFNYAMILKTNGNYDESNKAMDTFYKLQPGDLRAKDYEANKGEFANLSKDNGKYKIGRLKVNTNAHDFAPTYYKDKIVFASSGPKPDLMKKTYNWNGKPFLDLYVSEMDQNQLKTPDKFDKKFNRKMHDGPATFSKDGNYMAFTRNYYGLKRKDKVVNIEICFSNYKDGQWSKPQPFDFNSKEYSVGHPCLIDDGNTMYFTSDMPGGFGGADIYRSTKNITGEWSNPENLGNKINTEGDEMFPFYEEDSRILFFASNGRYGLGGLDIFICDSGFNRVYNAGTPLNTSYDDFAVIVNNDMENGYFSSNRSGGSGDDDIYYFDLLQISKQIKGIAREKDGRGIPKTFITLLDDKGNVIDTLTTSNDAAYTFSAASDKNFTLIGQKEKYIDGSSIANTFGKELIIKSDITLVKEEFISQVIPVGSDLGKVLELNPIYFDLDKYNIRLDAEIELKKIVQVMNSNPAMIVELGAYTDCRASKVYNQILSDRRAAASVKYIKDRVTNPERIYGKGYGETNLKNGCVCEGIVVSNCSNEEFQSDRRTEFIIISNDKIIGFGEPTSQK